jgi:Planctomycete cytochrome C
MKKVSIVQAVSLFAGVFFLSASLLQCTKDGELVKNLDRSYTGGPDSTVYAAFYESNTISTADVVPDVNDVIKMRGVQTIIHEYCNTSNCHGGPIAPRFGIYSQIMQYVKPGDPEGSKLWEYITTNDFDKAMPPVNSNHELGQRDKSIIYNWIRNGAKERPDLSDLGLQLSGY